MDKIKVGIIGLGRVGALRYDLLSKDDRFDVVAVCDTKDALLAKYSHDVRVYSNYKYLLRNDVDAVFVCVPHTLTPKISIEALKRGLHVFLEKPPGVFLADAKAIKSYINNNQKVQVGFNHRYMTHVCAAKAYASPKDILWMKGTYGRTTMSGEQEQWREIKALGGRGILISQGLHMIDLMRMFAEDEFPNVYAIVKHYQGKWNEDNVMILMESAHGISAMMHSSCVIGKNTFQLEIKCKRRTVKINGLGMSSTKSYGYPDEITILDEEDECFIGNPPACTTYFGDNNSWKWEIDNFARAILNNDPIQNNIDSAIKTMEIVEEVYKYDNSN